MGNIPSVGVEAYSFNQIGDEVLLRRVAKIKSVAVQLSSWACKTGSWDDGQLRHHTRRDVHDADHPEPLPGLVHERDDPGDDPRRADRDRDEDVHDPVPPVGQPELRRRDGRRVVQERPGLFNGLAHTIGFTLNGLKKTLPKDVVWGVSYNSDNSGPEPIHGTGTSPPIR